MQHDFTMKLIYHYLQRNVSGSTDNTVNLLGCITRSNLIFMTIVLKIEIFSEIYYIKLIVWVTDRMSKSINRA